MLNPESIQENEKHKLLWDFEIQMGQQISVRRPDLIIIIKKTACRIVDFTVRTDYRVKLKECKKRDKCLDLAKELKKLLKIKVTIIPIVIGAFGTVTKRLVPGLEDLEIKGQLETIQTTAIFKIGRNTERSAGELRRLDVTHTPVRKPSGNAGVKTNNDYINNDNKK